jgi:hypothetical protein
MAEDGGGAVSTVLWAEKAGMAIATGQGDARQQSVCELHR